MIKNLSQSFLLQMLFLFLLFPYMLSCATTVEISDSALINKIENVPFYPQETYQCGPSALAGVLNYWGINANPEDIAREIFSISARGTLTLDMILYAQKKGLNAEQYRGSIEDIKRNIDAGYPVIVLVDYGGTIYQANHFMVVTGYNKQGIIANSGREKGKFIPEKDFLKTWKKTNYLTLLIKK